jgi:hypothetical protein
MEKKRIDKPSRFGDKPNKDKSPRILSLPEIMIQAAEDFDKNPKPYLEKEIKYTEYSYNPKYGDNRLCECGHVYYRHFDSYEEMEAIGCKYCACNHFKEDSDTRLKHLSRDGRNNVLIGDFVGLTINYVRTYAPEEDVDMQIDCPDFFDHDTQLLYLYEEDQPYEAMKFNSDWNWLMPVIGLINDFEDSTELLKKDWNRITKSYTDNNSFLRNDIGPVYRGVVQYLEALKKYNIKTDEDKSYLPKES